LTGYILPLTEGKIMKSELTAIELRVLLLRQGKTTTELAKHLLITPCCISAWTKRRKLIPAKYIPGICSFLGVKPAELPRGDHGKN